MIDIDTGNKHQFFIDRWLAEDEDDGEVMREAAVDAAESPGKDD